MAKSCPLFSLPSPELTRAFKSLCLLKSIFLRYSRSECRIVQQIPQRLPRIISRNADSIRTSEVKSFFGVDTSTRCGSIEIGYADLSLRQVIRPTRVPSAAYPRLGPTYEGTWAIQPLPHLIQVQRISTLVFLRPIHLAQLVYRFFGLETRPDLVAL
jgi:hypothetical protein